MFSDYIRYGFACMYLQYIHTLQAYLSTYAGVSALWIWPPGPILIKESQVCFISHLGGGCVAAATAATDSGGHRVANNA